MHFWFRRLYQPQNLGKDLFGFELKYQNPVSNGKESPKYNGNISQMGAYNDGDTNIYVVDSKGKRTGEVGGKTIEAFDFMLTNDKTGEFIRPTEKDGIMFNPKLKKGKMVFVYQLKSCIYKDTSCTYHFG